MKIVNVIARIETVDDKGNEKTFLADAPTIEMAIEKMGAIERKLEKDTRTEELRIKEEEAESRMQVEDLQASQGWKK